MSFQVGGREGEGGRSREGWREGRGGWVGKSPSHVQPYNSVNSRGGEWCVVYTVGLRGEFG